MKSLYVTRGKVAIKEDAAKNETSNGIIYQEKDSPVHGTGAVYSIGMPRILSNGTEVPLGIEVGTKVLFSKKEGYSTFAGYTILNQEHVLGVVGETD